jgi:uncharacterized protein (TIGR02217 family)
MSFFEAPRFPDKISYGATGGPGYSTEIVTVESGREKRNARRSTPLLEGDVAHAVRTQAELEALRTHFLVMQGPLHGFRFKDWSDYVCSITQGVVTEITTTKFQLWKRYTTGSLTKDRQIRKPLATPFVLKNSGTPLTEGVDFFLNTTEGHVDTTDPRTAANLTWSGEFDVPSRYASDRFQASIVSRTGAGLLYAVDSVLIVEYLLDPWVDPFA